MTTAHVPCPRCRIRLQSSQPLLSGQAIQCPGCGLVFTVPVTAFGPGAPAASPPSPIRWEEPRAEDGTAPGGSRALAWALVLGSALLLLGGGIALVVSLLSEARTEAPRDPPVAKDRPPARRLVNKEQPVPPPRPRPWLPESEQQKVDQAIARGVAFLKRRLTNQEADPQLRSTGGFALAGLTLLNCGVPATDPAVRAVIAKVRSQGPQLAATYELATSIWFLDRLGEAQDRELIRIMALRLATGQSLQGGWPYQCAGVPAGDRQQFLALLRSKSAPPADTPAHLKNLPVLRFQPGDVITLGPPGGMNSNSLTLFALLALWAADKHGVPAGRSLLLAEARFRACQMPAGNWQYEFGAGRWTLYDSMTCAGLLALAAGQGVRGGKLDTLVSDPAVQKGFRHLGQVIGRPPLRRTPGEGKIVAVDAYGDLYFFWALERLAMVYDLRRIEGKDWYAWGAGLLVPTQNADGSWTQFFRGGVDTCFALLFLKRVNVVKDLTAKLKLGS